MDMDSNKMDWRPVVNAVFKATPATLDPKVLLDLKRCLERLADSSAELGEFLSVFVPWAIDALNTLPPSNEKAQKCREGVIDCISLLPSLGEAVKPFLEALAIAMLKVLWEDNEANALVAMHIYMEFHKVFRSAVESSVQPFLDFVLRLLDNYANIAESLVAGNLKPAPNKHSLSALNSVRIIIESPVTVVLLFQLHRKFINDNILRFVPLIIRILGISIVAPPLLDSHSIGLIRDLSGINGQIRGASRQAYCDFIQAKVKVLSFLAYVSRSFASALKPHQSAIPFFVIDILKNCPPESASARKELLVAVRHILATELRQAFVAQFENLLDEDLLLGNGYTSSAVMRPLVFSTIADLVHHIRMDLSAPMILRIVDIYARCFHDPSLPLGIQTMSAKLLLNLMDCVNGEKMTAEHRRPATMRILTILLCKYRRLSRIVEEMNIRRFSVEGSAASSDKSLDIYWDDSWQSRAICTDAISSDSNRDNVRDIKFILKTITAGIKSIVLSFKTNYITFNADSDIPAHPTSAFTNSCNFSLEESKLFVDLFRDGVACFDICMTEAVATALTPNASIAVEDKELIDQFAYIFTLLDPYIFQDVMSTHIEYLFNRIVKNPVLLIIPQYFLAINTVSRGFAGILVKFLMDKFEILKDSNPTSGAVIRLFKLSFLALSVYPEENEHMILPYVSDIILNCLRLNQKTSTPLNYFLLLKALFRGIAGGRFELLYKEVLPILPLLLETLNRLATNTTDKQMQDLYVELCLTTPVRLSVLLPYLPFLMKPMVLALNSGSDLVNQGLRTLELCVDNLTQDFLEPILSPVLPQLMSALWFLVKPAPSNQAQAQAAIRIMGKFGGRGRRFLKYPLHLSYKESSCPAMSIVLSNVADADSKPSHATELALPLDDLIDLAADYFSNGSKHANFGITDAQFLRFAMSCLSSICQFDIFSGFELVVNLEMKPLGEPMDVDLQASFDEAAVLARLKESRLKDVPQQALLSGEVVGEYFKRLMKALFSASIIDPECEVSITAWRGLVSICNRFCLLQILAQSNQAKDYSFAGFTPNLFLKVLSEVICGDNAALSQSALRLLDHLHQSLIKLVPVEKLSEMPVFFLLMEDLIASCYNTDFTKKMSACLGVKRICSYNLGMRWMWVQESRMVRGLLYVFKDVPAYVPKEETSVISETLLDVFKACHASIPYQDRELLSKSQYYFNQIMSILISEMTNSNDSVRCVVRSGLQLLAHCQGCDISALLAPHRDRLLMPIFTKPLRVLPFSLQIGYVDAVNYCLNLPSPLVVFSEELLRLLHEALALVEADDTALVSKTGQLKNAANLTNLRVVCISLLTSAISLVEFQDPKMHQIRNHIVSAFFKSLYSKSPEIVESAKLGLETVILHQQKLPKDLLQHGLRPVLINLAEAKRLTLSGLEGLSKVLQLLTSYFKAEIGKKLLDHINIWADQKLLEELSAKTLLESMEVKVIVAILDVFYLLPPSANLFLDDLIAAVTKLDNWTKRTYSSPFRPPLLKFMLKHASDTIGMLWARSKDQIYWELFLAALDVDKNFELLGALISDDSFNKFVDAIRTPDTPSSIRAIQLKVLLILVKSSLMTNQNIRALDDLLLHLLHALNVDHGKFVDTEFEVTQKIVFERFRHLPVATEIVFSLLLTLEGTECRYDHTWIAKSIRDCCISDQPVAVCKSLIESSLSVLGSSDIANFSKARIIRLVLLPLLAYSRENGSAALIFDHQSLKKIEKTIWDHRADGLDRGLCALRLEELQLTCSLVNTLGKELRSYSAAIRRFTVWRNLSPDPVIRYSSIITACHLIMELNCDDFDRLFNILGSSLCIPTSEVRPLFRQMLSLIFPRMLNESSLDFLKSWFPSMIADLSKQSHFLTVIAVFWNLLVGMNSEGKLDKFIVSWTQALISCLSKAALSVLSVPESRNVTFDVMSMIIGWIEKDFGIIGDDVVSSDLLLHTLVRMTLLFADSSADSKSFSLNGLALIGRLVKVLNGHKRPFHLRFDFFIANLPPSVEVSEETLNLAVLFLRILACFSQNADDFVLTSAIGNIRQFLFFALTSGLEKLVREALPLLDGICLSGCAEIVDFMAALNQSVTDSLQNFRSIECCFLILNSLLAKGIKLSDMQLTMLLRVFQKIGRDHLAQQDLLSDKSKDESARSAYLDGVLLESIRVANACFLNGESASRSVVFAILKGLWEHSMTPEVIETILNMLLTWFNSSSAELVDLKEKSDLLSTPSKMFEIQRSDIIEKYLDLVYLVYSNRHTRVTDLVVKLEGSFLYGLCYPKPTFRSRFVKLIDELLPRRLDVRLLFVFSSQKWNLVSNVYWIAFALEFLLLAVPEKIASVNIISWPAINMPSHSPDTDPSANIIQNNFPLIFDILRAVIHENSQICHNYWILLFSHVYSNINQSNRDILLDHISKILSDPDFVSCSLQRPNVMCSILDALASLPDPPDIPTQLVAYVGSTFGAWYSACLLLEAGLNRSKTSAFVKPQDLSGVKDVCNLYEKLGAFDLSCGLLRRYSVFPDTNIALSLEQNGRWISAQKILEKAQIKAKNGSIPFVEDEYSMWENHWETCAKKLQQWDLLMEVSKVDQNPALALDCEWVLNDWSRSETKSHIESLLSQSKEESRQKKLMECFLTLNQLKDSAEKMTIFQSSMEALYQDSIIAWAHLPSSATNAHCMALEQIQVLIELQESASFFANVTNSMNRPQFLQDLKALLSTWRDRLPNTWEDTGTWSDLLAWRQHVFTAINSVFHNGAVAANPTNDPAASNGSGSTGNSNSHPFAYRGYHETAWLINRFAHVARKNELFDVSLSFLNKIYTLPNIEIQDAFLKLREQAKCYMQNPTELPTALEVINATNLNYFNNSQKAELFTMKAVVLSRLGMIEEANRVFAQAVQIDLNIAKGWSAWGYFNDQRFQQSKDITFGVNAVNCYLQAATLYKYASARKYLARVLWLLTFEDASGSMSKSFELYNHDLAAWYWVPFIPELLTSLTRREARQARFLLMKIAKSFPQALYFSLRTANDEFRMQGNSVPGAASASATSPGSACAENQNSEEKETGSPGQPVLSLSAASAGLAGASSTSLSQLSGMDGSSGEATNDAGASSGGNSEQPFVKKPSSEHAADLIGILKTGYPLLALSLENMVEHIIHRLRSSPEEDLYRIIMTLISENHQQTMLKLNANASEQSLAPQLVLEMSLKRVADMLNGSTYLSQKFKAAFENDFLKEPLSLQQSLAQLLKWKQQLAGILDKLPNVFHMENFSRYLAEFEYQKYDDVEIPGQYLSLRDSGSDFIKLERFNSKVEIVRRHGTSFRRLVMIGQDGSRTEFIIQNPSGRQSRREERVMQLLRFAESIIDKKVFSRRHHSSFSVQNIVPLSGFVRLIQDSSSYVSFEGVYEGHCRLRGIQPEDPLIYFRDCLIKGIEGLQVPFKKGSVDLLNLRVDIFDEICRAYVPADVLTRYVQSFCGHFNEYWNFRRRFTSQYASFIFVSYILAAGYRFPFKIGFTRDSAQLISQDLLPMLNQNGQIVLTEAVPFRLTPNIQHFITSNGIEGALTSEIMTLGQALAGRKMDWNDYLSLFIRDEIFHWAQSSQLLIAASSDEGVSLHSEIATKTLQNVEIVMKRAQNLACERELEKGSDLTQPLDQTVSDLISCAVNPQKLAHMDSHWHPWF